MDKIEIFVKIFVGAIGFFDFEGIQSFGANDAFDFVMIIDYREDCKTRFIEFVKDKWTENVRSFDKNHVGALDHEVSDEAIIKTHDGRNAGAGLVV